MEQLKLLGGPFHGREHGTRERVIVCEPGGAEYRLERIAIPIEREGWEPVAVINGGPGVHAYSVRKFYVHSNYRAVIQAQMDKVNAAAEKSWPTPEMLEDEPFARERFGALLAELDELDALLSGEREL